MAQLQGQALALRIGRNTTERAKSEIMMVELDSEFLHVDATGKQLSSWRRWLTPGMLNYRRSNGQSTYRY